MFGIGNKFGGARRRAPVERNQAENSGNLVGARLTLGRANKALEAKADELVAARARLTELDQVIGEKIADDLDANADSHERQSLQALVQQLESATAVLRQRRDEAERVLKQAEQDEAVEKQVLALLAFQNEAKHMDAALAELERSATRLAQAATGIGAASGSGTRLNFLTDARLELERFVGIACFPFTGKGAWPRAMMKSARFSGVVPDPDIARTRKRP